MVSDSRDRLDAALSALADGAGSAQDWELVQAAWADDPKLRARWAEWHCLGDGLRSSELPGLHRGPELLLDRLHAEPDLLPAPPVSTGRPQRDWWSTVAVAAGFAAVAALVPGLRASDGAGPDRVANPAVQARAQILPGVTFAQTALGHNAGAWQGIGVPGVREVGLEYSALIEPATPSPPPWLVISPPDPSSVAPRR